MTTINVESFHALIEPEIPQHWGDRDQITRELDVIFIRWNSHLMNRRSYPSVAETAASPVSNLISDPQYELDLCQGQQFAADMAQALRLDINLIYRINTIVAATCDLPYSAYAIGENNEASIIVIVTARIGQLIPVNPSFLRTSDRPIATDTATLRASLLMASTSTDYVTFLRVSSQPWANAILELLQLEIKLSDMLQATESVDTFYKQKCMRCLRQISSAYEVLPPSFLIHASDVVREGNNPISGGGFADIWKGLMLGQNVCLKVLRFFTTTHIRKKLLQDVCREALVWKQLDHPGVLKFLGVSVDMFFPSFCLVSPWMANGNINDYLQVYPNHDLLTVLREVAEAMQYLHEYTPCIVHADIRGANILVTDDGHCVLADFGLASVSETQSLTTSSVGLTGSVRWLSPEVLSPTASQRKPHPSRDIYAYGCTALEIYTKLPPFHSYYHDITIFSEVISGKRPDRPTQEEAPCLTDNVWQLIEQCWRQDASMRPQAREVVNETINLIQGRFADQMAQDCGTVRNQASSLQMPVRQCKTEDIVDKTVLSNVIITPKRNLIIASEPGVQPKPPRPTTIPGVLMMIPPPSPPIEQSTSSPKSPYPNRSSGSLSNSDRSTRSTTKYINILEHNNNLPPMPLGMSDNVEYFSKAALGMSPSSGYVIQSRDSKPTGIFFHPNPRSTIPRVPSVGHPMERDRGQSLSTISHLPSRSATGDMSPMSFSSLHSAVITPRAMTRKISSSAVPLAKSRMEPSTTIPGVSTAIPSPNISFAQAHPAVRNVRTPSVSRTPVKGNAVEANSVPKVSVLIVDDNPINQSILSTFMRKKKIKYAVASDGAEAVEKWRTGEFHLILMDIQMPIMDGIKAAIEIRRLEKSNASAGNPPLTDSGSPMQTPSKLPDRMAPDRSSVIIVALTTTSSDRVAALAAGCNDFLTKPVSLLWLNNKITEWGSIKMLQMWADPGPEPAQTQMMKAKVVVVDR